MNAAIVVRLMIKNLIRYIFKSWYRIIKRFEDLKSAFKPILKKLFQNALQYFFNLCKYFKNIHFFLNFEP